MGLSIATAYVALRVVCVAVLPSVCWRTSAGLLAGLALLTSKGFVAGHVARTGDYEALLLLFTTSQVLAVFAWLQTRQRRFLFLAGATVGLAVLTKGIAGLLFLPGIGIEVIRRGRLVTLLRQPATWAAFVWPWVPPLCGMQYVSRPGRGI
jgi:4-amino-4-deoxy-L-arabinose transferase-like glycosyltransferase